jgi:cytochrome c oxidase subunit 4
MSNHAHDHGGGHGADHVPHVLSLKYYYGVFAALLVFTVLTVAVSYVDLGRANLFIALAVATCKALMVGAIFMHLAFDKKFNAIIFASSIIFLAIFIAFTMFDTNYRGMADRLSADRPADVTQPFAGSKADAALKDQWTPKPAGEHKSE